MKTNELQPGTIVVMNATMRNEPPKVRRTDQATPIIFQSILL
jgi:hypothetical protein